MTTVRITGMTCASCEQRVTRALSALPGVEAVAVSAARGRATLTGTPPSEDVVRAAVERAGYQVGTPPWLSRDRDAWRTVALAALAATAVGVIALGSGVRVPTSGDASPYLVRGLAGSLVLALLVGLAAGVSTCMALVGGLVLGVSAGRAPAGTAGRVPATSGDAPRRAALRGQLVFTAGRLAGFAAGGALLGALGSAARLPDRAVAAAAVVAAAVMTLLGVRLTGLSPRVSGWALTLPGRWGDRFGLHRDRGALVAGAATFLLPCGFTQAVQLYAISLGSVGAAAATMTAFALGTTPGLLGLGTVGSLSARQERTAPAVRAVGVVVIAFALVTGTGGLRALGLSLPDVGSPAAVAAPTAVSPNVQLADGAQVVTMTQSADGYAPADIVVWAGVPIRWDIDVTAQFSCSSFLRVPSVGVSADLTTKGRHVVDVPALAVGTTPFTCVMGMYTGTFRAIPRPATPSPHVTPSAQAPSAPTPSA